MKIRVDLSEISRCAKPRCKHQGAIIHRHHLRHEKTWINLFDRIGPPPWPSGKTSKPGMGRSILNLLKERYYAFRPQDIVNLCEWHHVEIHNIYNDTIHLACLEFNKRKTNFSWKEAIICMYRCKKICQRWLKMRTYGQSPERARKGGHWG